MAFLKKTRLSRRALLRGGAGGLGVAIALPTLEVMFDTDRAYAQASRPPRFLAIYQPNGHKADEFAPRAGGVTYSPDLSGTNTSPLQRHMDVTTIFTNFQSNKAGGQGNAHLLAITSWLRGTHTVDDGDTSMRRFTVGPNNRSSADAFVAQVYEERHPRMGGGSQHLVLRGSAFYDGGRGGYNNRQKQWLSTAADGSRIDAEFDLTRVYDEMFAGADPDASAQEAQARLRLRRSVLDSVLPQVDELEGRLGANDRQTLESYFTNIRALETRLQAPGAERPTQVAVPNMDAIVQHQGSGHNSRGWYVDDNYNGRGHNHIDYHWRDTARLLTVAFQNDTVRSVAYMLESEAGENHYVEGPNGEPGLGDNHGASHANNRAYGVRDFRHAQVYADMIDAFKDTPDVSGGRLIDHTMVLWGAGIGVTHSSDRVMAVMSGLTDPSYGIRHDAIRNMGGQSQKPLMQTILRRMGVLGDRETFGEGNEPSDEVDLDS